MKRVSIGFSWLPAGPTVIDESADRGGYLAGRLAALCHHPSSQSELHPLPLGWSPMCDPFYMCPQGQGVWRVLRKPFSSSGNVVSTPSILRKGLGITEAIARRQCVYCGVK